MARAARFWLSLLVVTLALGDVARAGETDCGCGSAAGSGSGEYWNGCGSGSIRPRWAAGEDGCPLPDLRYESPRSRWYASTDALALKRDPSDERPFATLGAGDNVVLSTSDLEYQFRAGVKTLVGVHLRDCFAVEASYFGLMDYDQSKAIRNVATNADGTLGNLFSPFSNFGTPAGVVGLDFNTLASIRTTSSLDNVEINFRHLLNTPPGPYEASFLYGLRYMKIDERFEYRTDSQSPAAGGGTTNLIDVDTGNSMIGFQVGGAIEARVEERWWINFEAKGAILHNDADQTTVFDVNGLGGTGTAGDQRTVFAGDLALTFMYQFNSAIVGRIGYQAIWVDGLALASENFESNASLLTLGPPQLVHDGSVVYHGPFAGVMVTW